MPALGKAGASLHTIVSREGVSAAAAGRKFGFLRASSDIDAVLTNADLDTVFIATPHESHAELVLEALAAGKHVFVEKPLATRLEDLERIWLALGDGQRLCVGFNRRFSPLTIDLQRHLRGLTGVKSMVMMVNAGDLPGVRDRMVGEGCHFIDLLRHLAGVPVGRVRSSLQGEGGTVTLEFVDGSVGTVHYFTNGHRSVAKEKLQVFCGGKVLEIDNFRRLWVHGGSGGRRLWRQDKGQLGLVAAFMAAVRDGRLADPIPVEELFEVSRVTLEAAGMPPCAVCGDSGGAGPAVGATSGIPEGGLRRWPCAGTPPPAAPTRKPPLAMPVLASVPLVLTAGPPCRVGGPPPPAPAPTLGSNRPREAVPGDLEPLALPPAPAPGL